jgi:hypothetical protein
MEFTHNSNLAAKPAKRIVCDAIEPDARLKLWPLTILIWSRCVAMEQKRDYLLLGLVSSA